MARRTASQGLLALLVLQITFAVVIAVVTNAQLDKASCYMNVSGNICDFAYATSGFSLFFSLLLLAGAVATLRASRTAPFTAFLPAECGSVAAFAGLWWVAAAVTFTLRGRQAADAGLPEGSARNAVIVLSWFQAILFTLAAAAVAYDRFLSARHAAGSKQQLLGSESSSSPRSIQQQEQGQFKRVSLEISPAVCLAVGTHGTLAAAAPTLSSAV